MCVHHNIHQTIKNGWPFLGLLLLASHSLWITTVFQHVIKSTNLGEDMKYSSWFSLLQKDIKFFFILCVVFLKCAQFSSLLLLRARRLAGRHNFIGCFRTWLKSTSITNSTLESRECFLPYLSNHQHCWIVKRGTKWQSRESIELSVAVETIDGCRLNDVCT